MADVREPMAVVVVRARCRRKESRSASEAVRGMTTVLWGEAAAWFKSLRYVD